MDNVPCGGLGRNERGPHLDARRPGGLQQLVGPVGWQECVGSTFVLRQQEFDDGGIDPVATDWAGLGVLQELVLW